MDRQNEYVIAEGPEGLKNVLRDFKEKVATDPNFASQEHYILYQLGNQRSLIKVDIQP